MLFCALFCIEFQEYEGDSRSASWFRGDIFGRECENWAAMAAYSVVMHEGSDLALALQIWTQRQTETTRERLMEAITSAAGGRSAAIDVAHGSTNLSPCPMPPQDQGRKRRSGLTSRPSVAGGPEATPTPVHCQRLRLLDQPSRSWRDPVRRKHQPGWVEKQALRAAGARMHPSNY